MFKLQTSKLWKFAYARRLILNYFNGNSAVGPAIWNAP